MSYYRTKLIMKPFHFLPQQGYIALFLFSSVIVCFLRVLLFPVKQ